jgi:hypothetical protein
MSSTLCDEFWVNLILLHSGYEIHSSNTLLWNIAPLLLLHVLLYNKYRFFPGGKERPGRDSDPSPPSSAAVMKEYSYTSTPPMGRTAYTEPQCLYKGAFYLYL